MNSFQTPPYAIAGPRFPRLIAGLALSGLVHVALLLAWRHDPPTQPAASAPAPTSIAVWLRPPPAPKIDAVRVSAHAAKSTPAAPAKPRRRAPPNLIALPAPASTAPARPEAFTVEAPSAPRFDAEAARRMARSLASEPDPAKAGTAVAQLPAKALETETRAARAISGAKRRDCKDGIPGGLLAPLILMMDKKDSGCKW
ncbi:MAG: hypothetical protein H7335_10005 [Massilia sp.]|nr:hypothetical protein [Massilia sp.]